MGCAGTSCVDHDPSLDLVRRRAPAATILGARDANADNHSATPGPGRYNPDDAAVKRRAVGGALMKEATTVSRKRQQPTNRRGDTPGGASRNRSVAEQAMFELLT